MGEEKLDARNVEDRQFAVMGELNTSAKHAVALHSVSMAEKNGNAGIVAARHSAAMVKTNGCARIAGDAFMVKFRACARNVKGCRCVARRCRDRVKVMAWEQAAINRRQRHAKKARESEMRRCQTAPSLQGALADQRD